MAAQPIPINVKNNYPSSFQPGVYGVIPAGQQVAAARPLLLWRMEKSEHELSAEASVAVGIAVAGSPFSCRDGE